MIVRFVTVLVLSVTSLRADPCDEYRTIVGDHRSILSGPRSAQGEANLCDNTLDEGAWYRFDVLPPSRIHNECVSIMKCGTEHPIWMRGRLPTARDQHPIDAEACSPNADGSDCCGYWREKIKVKYCRGREKDEEDYYVYHLKKAPRCDMAYCAGDVTVCPPGQIYNPNIRGCTERYPNCAPPVFRGPERVNRTMTGMQYEDFCFVCEIQRLSADPDGMTKGQRFEVSFTFDGKESTLVRSKIVNGSDLRVRLWSRELYNNTGKTVGCKVRSFWYKAERYKSEYFAASGKYFVGIRYSLDNKNFDSPRCEIDEKDPPLTLYFRSTVPVSCPENDPASTCQFSVNVLKDDRLKTSSCSMLFSAFGKTESIGVLRIQPIPTPGLNLRTFVIRFAPVIKDPNYFWHNYNLTEILIVVKDSTKPSTCTSWGDPHFVTFDGRLYDDYQAGDFVYAKSTAGRHFEVHIRHHKCHTVTCNCAVVVREGNNVLGINACQPPLFTPTLITFLRDPKVPGASITSVGNRYTIMMPSGAYLIADWYLWPGAATMHFNIYLYSTSADRGKMLGLCGDNNGNPHDDTKINGTQTIVPGAQPRDFVNSYRLRPEESFINGHVYKIPCLDLDKLLPTICKCEKGNIINCADPQNSRQTFITQHTNNCNRPEVVGPGPKRRRRQAMADDDDMMLTVTDMPMPVFDETVQRTFTWPTSKGTTEAQARQMCDTRLRESPVYQECMNMMTGKTEPIIASCISDIQITDDVEMSVSNVINEYQSNCMFNLETSVERDSETSPPTAAEIQMANIMSKLCPNQCNSKGTCNNGTCQCNDGFGGEDCSINTRQPPELLKFRKSSLCDMRKSPCTMTSILASNFMQSSKLGCRVSAVNQSKTFNLGASLMSSMEVVCHLPVVNRRASAGKTMAAIKSSDIYHWDISLTNDGNLHSNALRMVVYDSKCQDCNSDGVCLKIADGCSFGNSIYAVNYFVQFAVICFGLCGRFLY